MLLRHCIYIWSLSLYHLFHLVLKATATLLPFSQCCSLVLRLFTPYSSSDSGDRKKRFLILRKLRLFLVAALTGTSTLVSGQSVFSENERSYSISQRSFTSVPIRWYEAAPDSGTSLFFGSANFGYGSQS